MNRSPKTLAALVMLAAGALVVWALAALSARPGGRISVGQPPQTEVPGTAVPVTSTTTVTPDVTTEPTAEITATATLSPTAAISPTETATLAPTETQAPSPEPTATQTPTTVNLPYAARAHKLAVGQGRVWGLQFGLEFLPEAYREYVRVGLPRGSDAGLRSVRTTLRWDRVEPRNTTPDKFDWREHDKKLSDYARAGFDTLVSVVAYPAWATEWQCGGSLKEGMDAEWREFMREAARRYSAAPYKVVAWEIGNEVDNNATVDDDDCKRPPDWGGCQPTVPYGGCWGGRTPQYVAFMRSAYEEVKAVHPDIPVTIGGLGYSDVYNWFDMQFLDRYLAAGGGAYMDFLGYHWFPQLKDAFPDTPTGLEKYRTLADTLKRHGANKPIWLTETYRYTRANAPDTVPGQIRFLTQELPEFLAQTDIQRVYWYSFADFPPGFSENERGLLTHEMRPKPALSVLPYTVEYTQGFAEGLSTDRVIAYRFRRPRAAGYTVIAWSRDGQTARFELPAQSNRPASVVYFPPDMLIAGRCCGRAEVPPAGGVYGFDVGADALFISVDRER